MFWRVLGAFRVLGSLVAELQASKRACLGSANCLNGKLLLCSLVMTTNLFLAVEACYGPLTLGQVVVHTTDVVPLTLNSKACRGA